MSSILTALALTVLAVILGGILFVVAAFFFLPDESPVPLWAVAAGTAAALLLAGGGIGWVWPHFWYLAGVLAWPFLIIGLGLLATEPQFSPAWFATLPVALTGALLGRLRRRTKQRRQADAHQQAGR